MACPFFTTIKMITALMILVFSFMQLWSFRKRLLYPAAKPAEDQKNVNEETDESETEKTSEADESAQIKTNVQ